MSEMKREKMIYKRPMIVTVIGDINLLGVILSIISVFSFWGSFGFKVYSLPYYLNAPISFKIFLIILGAINLFVISYGYLKLKLWGYWLTVCYNILTLIGWIITYKQNKLPLYAQGITPIIIQLIFTLPTIKYFLKSTSPQD
jgi:hypothetical protein